MRQFFMARVLFAATLFITSGAPRARADGPAQAQQWLDASTVRAKQGHFIAIAQVLANGSDPGFRYDSFPGVERIIAPDGKVFTRAQGKPWMESADWGKTGAPADEKRAADLDALVELAHRPFQPVAPDPVEGAARWRQADPGGNTFDLTREKPSRSPAHPYPHFEFHENPDESAEIFLRLVDAFWRWNGATAHVYVFYFYPQGEKSPPVQPAPEDQLA
ncbi:MAG TPA: hypothetical protein VG733_17390, partial [Chthoniobacteraceae bacterium]|nr:hypothetical protein [Chthoniobacteraceae bacterium]